MTGLFHKTFFKRLIILLLLVCLTSESIFSSNAMTVQAANITSDTGKTNENSEVIDANDNTTSETQDSSTENEANDSSLNSSEATTNNTSTDDTNTDSNSETNTTNTDSNSDNSNSITDTDVNTDSSNLNTKIESSSNIDSNSDTNITSDINSNNNTSTNTNESTAADNSSDIKTDITELEISSDVFPDDVFMSYVADNFDIDKNKALSADEISKIESIDVSNMGINDLTGIEYFTNVNYLYCNSNKLHTLKVDTLVNMTVLNCSYNYLTSLDLSKCSSLVSLECDDNAFTMSLDQDNSFDLSSLSGFNIENASDWSKNITLNDTMLTVSDDFNSSLITYRYLVNAPLITDAYIDFSFVIATDTLSEIQIDETNFPDPSFREYLLETYDIDKDSLLSVDEQLEINYIFVPSQNITSLEGIEYFTNLVYLNFENNNVSSVAFNHLVNLRSIYCSNNQLVEISFDNLIYLENFYCSNNQLTHLDVGQLPVLSKLYCDGNLLSTLDVSNLTNLTELNCSNNKLYSLDLSNCTSLELLECKDNISEVFLNNNEVDLSSLSLLDLSRTDNWSEGALSANQTLLLDNFSDQMTVTYTYLDNAPNLPDDAITFTLKISQPAEQTSELALTPAVQAETQSEVPNETIPSPPTLPAASATPSIVCYLITFNSDGGSNVDSQSVQADNKVAVVQPPVKSGYLFDGWYNGDSLFDFNTTISSDITLTAHWQLLSPPQTSIKSLKNYKKSQMKITLKSTDNIDGYEVSYSTYKNVKKNVIVVNSNKTKITIKNLVKDKTYYVKVRTYCLDSTGEKVFSKYSKIKKLKIKKGLTEAKATSTSATIRSCKITSSDNVSISAKTNNIIKSKDNYYYLFKLPSYKKSISKNAAPLDNVLKSTSFKFSVPLNLNTSDSLLYSKFVVAIKVKSGYKIISKAKYITNPQKAATYTYSFPTAATKKGLQINAGMLNDVKDLGVKNSAFNIPLDMIIAAPGEENYRSGIDYEYNGETYWFRKGMIAAYDSLFRQLENQDIVVTAIILLGWRNDLTYLITPSGRKKGHYYYNFNTSNSKARKQLEATFSFLAERYASDDGNGKVVNWIIGNEINSFDAWNYAGTKSLSKYTQLYADSYRLAYNAIKSVYSNARLYVSLDQCWNISNSATFSGKEFLQKFDSILEEYGNISWNLAYHAYPSPLTNPKFWKNSNGLSQNNENSPVISIYNISVLTNYIKKHYGKNTRIILSEQGFTSAAPYGEKVQAAAMAYSYYLAEFNPMIDAFILSRHVDNVAETKYGLNLGLWTNTPGRIEEAYRKKYAWKVYKYMDTPSSTKVTKFALKIIGKSSWKKIIPKYKSNKFKSMPNANE